MNDDKEHDELVAEAEAEEAENNELETFDESAITDIKEFCPKCNGRKFKFQPCEWCALETNQNQD